MATAVTAAVAAAAVGNLRAARAFQLSAFIILIFDHVITFGDEVERIWKRSWHFPTVLFFLNRYITPLMRIIIVVAFNDPDWSAEKCLHFVKFEGGGTMVLVTIAEVVMILRVYALYFGNKIVLAILVVSLIGQIVLTAFSLAATQPEPLLPGLRACILVGQKGNLFAAFWGASLWTDALVFAFTLFKVIQYRRNHLTTPILVICARDGILYFFVIFFANAFNTGMYLFAPPGVKAIGASFSQLITATMISRLQLNLRSASIGDRTSRTTMTDPHFQHRLALSGRPVLSTVDMSTQFSSPSSTMSGKLVGNLGQDLEPLEKSSHWEEEVRYPPRYQEEIEMTASEWWR